MNRAFNHLASLDTSIDTKLDARVFKTKKKKLNNKVIEYIDTRFTDFQSQIDTFSHLIDSKTKEFSSIVHETEVNTLWKIKDCENLLKTRISEKYVEDRLKMAKEDIKRDLGGMHEKNLERMEKIYKELGTKITI